MGKPGNLAPAPKRSGEGDSSTFHFPEMMLNMITSSVSDSLAMCPEYKVVSCRIRKARKMHLRKAGEVGVREMHRTRYLLALFSLLAATTGVLAQSDVAPPRMAGFCPTYTFEGSLTDGKGVVLPIHMEVLCLLDSTLVGSYYYVPQNGKLSLAGRLMSDSSLTLVERDEQERITGIFQGEVSGMFDSLHGNWTSAYEKRSMRFELTRALGSYTDYLAKWRSFPEYTDLDQALHTTRTVYQLDLGNDHLKELPSALDTLDELLSLSLLDNDFDTLPPVVCQLVRLEDLSLAGNAKIQIPPCIARLQNLRMLILTWNGHTELPSYLGELSSLMYLDASHNDLTTIPDEFIKLKSLEVLDLGYNRISPAKRERIRAMLPWCLVKFD